MVPLTHIANAVTAAIDHPSHKHRMPVEAAPIFYYAGYKLTLHFSAAVGDDGLKSIGLFVKAAHAADVPCIIPTLRITFTASARTGTQHLTKTAVSKARNDSKFHTYDNDNICLQDGLNDHYRSVADVSAVHMGEFGVGRLDQRQRDADIVRAYYRLTAKLSREKAHTFTIMIQAYIPYRAAHAVPYPTSMDHLTDAFFSVPHQTSMDDSEKVVEAEKVAQHLKDVVAEHDPDVASEIIERLVGKRRLSSSDHPVKARKMSNSTLSYPLQFLQSLGTYVAGGLGSTGGKGDDQHQTAEDLDFSTILLLSAIAATPETDKFPLIREHLRELDDVMENDWNRNYTYGAYMMGIILTSEVPFLLKRYYDLADKCRALGCAKLSEHETSLEQALQSFLGKNFQKLFLEAVKKSFSRGERIAAPQDAIMSVCRELLPAEIATLLPYATYTGLQYTEFNRIMRRSRFDDEDDSAVTIMAQTAVIAFFWFRSPVDIILYRGQSMGGIPAGNICTSGFYSFSTIKGIALSFAKALRSRSRANAQVLEVLVRAGQPIVPMMLLSDNEYEAEIALPPGCRLIRDDAFTSYTQEQCTITRYNYDAGDFCNLLTLEDVAPFAEHLYTQDFSPELGSKAHDLWEKLKDLCKRASLL
ncbi:hypothetical protein JKP88DRAFT_244893 [Tribonema minus]|uniref:Uncharacterized protein n=1 Tax=Tribonema minus TaxID=303371 RepID=A0A835Z831_9STRA|nr:hypothetical protein JKP88DRAFT_244893 [Tribonema minus]